MEKWARDRKDRELARRRKVVAAPKNDGVTATITQTPVRLATSNTDSPCKRNYPWPSCKIKPVSLWPPRWNQGRRPSRPSKCRKTYGRGSRIPRGQFLSDRQLHVAPLLQERRRAKSAALKELVKYCLTDGQKVSGEMGFIPLPETVVELVTKALDNIQ